MPAYEKPPAWRVDVYLLGGEKQWEGKMEEICLINANIYLILFFLSLQKVVEYLFSFCYYVYKERGR